jgi:ABC-type multidrug transport system fused ATPase/permease subunit
MIPVFISCLVLGGTIFFIGFGAWYTVLNVAVNVTQRTKQNYLSAILKQEGAWFDMVNYNELSARMTKETMAINKALGEKQSVVVQSIGMAVLGLAVAFIKGYSLAIAYCAICPVIILAGFLMAKTNELKFSRNLRAYA